jgi:uncharacterized Zn-finger protein
MRTCSQTKFTFESDTKIYSCNYCPNTSNKVANIKRHIQTHSSPNYKCDKCEKSFTRPDNLNTHITKHHQVIFPNGSKLVTNEKVEAPSV